MPRKELLVWGFRNTRLVAKHLRSKKLAAVKKLHCSASLPAKAAASGAKSTNSSQQFNKQPTAHRASRDGPAVPSFAASSIHPPAASPNLTGLPNLTAAAAAALQSSKSPSFAASPVWGGHAAAPASEPAQAASHAAASAPAAAAAPRGLPYSVKRNPLYRLAKLEQPASKPAEQATAADEKLGQALASYAKLGAPAAAAKSAASRLGSAAALLKYAKLK